MRMKGPLLPQGTHVTYEGCVGDVCSLSAMELSTGLSADVIHAYNGVTRVTRIRLWGQGMQRRDVLRLSALAGAAGVLTLDPVSFAQADDGEVADEGDGKSRTI